MRVQTTHLWLNSSPVLLRNSLSLFLFLDLQVGKRFFFFSLGLVGSESGYEVTSPGLDGKVMTEPLKLARSSSGEVPHWPSVLSASLLSLSTLFDFPNSFLILDFDMLMAESLRHIQRWSIPLVFRKCQNWKFEMRTVCLARAGDSVLFTCSWSARERVGRSAHFSFELRVHFSLVNVFLKEQKLVWAVKPHESKFKK